MKRMNFSRIRRVATVAMSATAATMLFATDASASWNSYLEGVKVGFESRRWTEEAYVELHFVACNSVFDYSTSPEIRKDNNNWPDYYYGEKLFTACFKNEGTSTGTESGLDKGTYFFRINRIDQETKINNPLSVRQVAVDSTLAD